MRKAYTFLFFALFFMTVKSPGQVKYTANERVMPYTEAFGYGSNMGYYPPWTDEQLADIAIGIPEKSIEGAGVNTIRPALFAHFLEQYGYDFRVSTFQHYQEIGMRNNVVFIGYPSDAQRDPTEYCPGHRSELFANMYAPIWDDGANGTPVNDQNAYALYLYKMISRYKDYVKIWEIWNEPDFDYSGKAWKPQNIPDNWWQANPDPCDYAIRAPAFHYIRLLRISWEVIKTLDPEAYVAIGGLGYPSFMDVVLRNTDNPEEGKVTAAFPLKGGAYFDMMSFHSYPHIDGSLRNWSDKAGGFVYRRHSDEAVKGVLKRKNEFADVLANHGYDNQQFPEKVYIITECNIPRKAFGDFIGSEEAQRNFIIKALVEAQKNDIHQFHIYNMGELRPYEAAQNEYDLMGLFQKLENVPPYQHTINTVGITYRTTSEILGDFYFDKQRTEQLQMPPTVNGAAFQNEAGDYRYVLWAITQKDQSEQASASYQFPQEWNISGFTQQNWEYSSTQESSFHLGDQIQLSGTPLFIEAKTTQDLNRDIVFDCSPSSFLDSLTISIFLPHKEKVNLSIWDHQGQLIRSYADGEKWESGSHQLLFADKIKAGLYICRLETKDRTLIQRVVKLEKH